MTPDLMEEGTRRREAHLQRQAEIDARSVSRTLRMAWRCMSKT